MRIVHMKKVMTRDIIIIILKIFVNTINFEQSISKFNIFINYSIVIQFNPYGRCIFFNGIIL
jgi:hypothetical protein